MSTFEKTRTPMLVAVTLLVLAGTLAATDDKAVGKELIEKARKISDIRAEGAPAFRLEGSFRIIPRKGGKEIAGSYTEIWVSNRKWRREEQTGAFHRIEIGAGTKKWSAGSRTNQVYTSFYPSLTLLFPWESQEPKVTKISERKIDSVTATCVESKSQWSKEIDCVDPASGVLVLRENGSKSGPAPSRDSCIYRNYEKFGDRLFPRLTRCSNDAGDDVELTVVKLMADSSPDEALFVRPPDALEYGNCNSRPTPPKVVHAPEPVYPGHSAGDFNGTVVLWTIVGEDGIPRNSQVVRSVGNDSARKDFDQAALDALQNWRFKPATCEGSPMSAQINVEMTFRKF